jgi:hypothetical protein
VTVTVDVAPTCKLSGVNSCSFNGRLCGVAFSFTDCDKSRASGVVNVCKDKSKADECHGGQLTPEDPIVSFEGFASTRPKGGVAGFKFVTKNGSEITLGNLAPEEPYQTSLGVKPIGNGEAIVGMKFDF